MKIVYSTAASLQNSNDRSVWNTFRFIINLWPLELVQDLPRDSSDAVAYITVGKIILAVDEIRQRVSAWLKIPL